MRRKPSLKSSIWFPKILHMRSTIRQGRSLTIPEPAATGKRNRAISPGATSAAQPGTDKSSKAILNFGVKTDTTQPNPAPPSRVRCVSQRYAHPTTGGENKALSNLQKDHLSPGRVILGGSSRFLRRLQLSSHFRKSMLLTKLQEPYLSSQVLQHSIRQVTQSIFAHILNLLA